MVLALIIGFFVGGTLISWWRSRRGRTRGGYPDTRELAIRQGEAVNRSSPLIQNSGGAFPGGG